MQKLEYKTVLQRRSWEEDKSVKKASWLTATGWSIPIADIEALGEEGWELVSGVPRSDYLGGYASNNLYHDKARDFAGFTSSEMWVFKRPKP